MSPASIWEEHSRQRQTKITGCDKGVLSRFPGDHRVTRSRSRVCVRVGGQKQQEMGSRRSEGITPHSFGFSLRVR